MQVMVTHPIIPGFNFTSTRHPLHTAEEYLALHQSTSKGLENADVPKTHTTELHCISLPTTLAPHIIIVIDRVNERCGPMPNVMAALPNIGGALCSTPQFG